MFNNQTNPYDPTDPFMTEEELREETFNFVVFNCIQTYVNFYVENGFKMDWTSYINRSMENYGFSGRLVEEPAVPEIDFDLLEDQAEYAAAANFGTW